MSAPDHEATETAREDIGRAEDALNGASFSTWDDFAGNRLANTAAVVTRTRATYARRTTKLLLIVGAIDIGTLVATFLLRRF